ncbi:phage NrS-1 polymerase family protein [Aurantiacibacter hainanensis]|uniref:phage NrS-1 polymerase family protein n=1 Tax=Aurantiacibacter hainanensis TaxID=3076114 RepID=UPI0030C6E7C5
MYNRWQRIPAELRQRAQWCITPGSDGDKAPRTITGGHASSTDSNSWTDFDTACREASMRGWHVGYMLQESDPFACIDLDVKEEATEADIQRLRSIIENLDSYTERSRSGRGWHIFVAANIGQGRRRDGVEVYSRERFMICTGDVERNRPVMERQEMLTNMVSRMQGSALTQVSLPDGPELDNDADIIERARSAANGDSFVALYEGKFDRIGHTDHSRADMALIAMLAFYTRSNAQLKRLFLASALGQRDKAQKRKDYVDRTIRAVRALAATGPTAEHGKEMALAIIGTALQRRLVPASPVISEDVDSLLDQLSIDWDNDDDAEVPDIVDGLVADEDVTLLGGHGGVGKGFLALQIACATALGEPILGCSTRQSRVLYYSAEDGRKRLTRRLRRVVDLFDYDGETLRQNLRVLDASEIEPLYGERLEHSPDGRRFAKVQGAGPDFDNLRRMVGNFDPQLVIIDGASDTFDGNEIARREVRAFIKLLRRVHPCRNIGVLLIVHIDRSSARGYATNDDGYAGSAQWHNSCRRRMFLQHKVKRDPEDREAILSESFVLRVMKNQDGPPTPDMELQRGDWGLWQRAVEIGGNLAPSHVPDHTSTIARLIGDYYDRGHYMSASLAPQASTGVFDTLKSDPSFPKGLTRKRTADIVRGLKRDGVLAEEPYKRPNRSWAERWMVLRDPDNPFRQVAPSAQTGTE